MYLEALRMSNIMSGPRFPLGQFLMWMGYLIWNFDILLDESHDVSRPGAKESIAEQANESHATTSGPACGITHELDRSGGLTSQVAARLNSVVLSTHWISLPSWRTPHKTVTGPAWRTQTALPSGSSICFLSSPSESWRFLPKTRGIASCG